ncbi:hypothetical protein E0D86_20400, partial [Pseudomonas sp. IC_126]
QPGAFYSNSPSVQALNFANFLICKRFRLGPAPEKVRIIGTQKCLSTAFLNYKSKLYIYRKTKTQGEHDINGAARPYTSFAVQRETL